MGTSNLLEDWSRLGHSIKRRSVLLSIESICYVRLMPCVGQVQSKMRHVTKLLEEDNIVLEQHQYAG